MAFYQPIYYTLCESRKQLKSSYMRYSGLHAHHIIPKHSGGSDDDSNITYLTIREHVIAHYLLWKIYQNANDLRSMKMLGAELSVEKRRIIGFFCRDSKLGYHGMNKEDRRIASLKGLETQKNSNSKNTFYYWSTEEGRKERASMGGKATMATGNNKHFLYWHTPEGKKHRAYLGSQAHKGKKVMHIPGETTFKRVKPENIDSFLEQGYVLGSPLKPNQNNKYTRPQHLKKRVTDGTVVYDSLLEAATKHNVTSATIINWCGSNRKPNWSYVL